MLKTSMQIKAVKPKRVKTSLVANDNEETLWSHLRWREQSSIQQRIDDLNWQLTYADIQLKSWRNLDNGNWQPLVDMREFAQVELNKLMFG